METRPVLQRRVGAVALVVYPAERSTLAGGRPRSNGSDTVYDVVAVRSSRTIYGVRSSRATAWTGLTYAQAERTLAAVEPRFLRGLRFK